MRFSHRLRGGRKSTHALGGSFLMRGRGNLLRKESLRLDGIIYDQPTHRGRLASLQYRKVRSRGEKEERRQGTWYNFDHFYVIIL